MVASSLPLAPDSHLGDVYGFREDDSTPTWELNYLLNQKWTNAGQWILSFASNSGKSSLSSLQDMTEKACSLGAIGCHLEPKQCEADPIDSRAEKWGKIQLFGDIVELLVQASLETRTYI